MTSGTASGAADELDQKVAAFVARMRKESGLSQAALAEELGQDQSFVSRVEHAQRRLTVGELLRWAGALGASFPSLMLELERLWRDYVVTESIWEREKRGPDAP